MNFKLSFDGQPTIASSTTLIEKNVPFFSFIRQTKSKIQTFLKANTVQKLHFPLTKKLNV